MTWPEADLDLLRRLWSEGASDSEIARELGWRYTRNAVIGMRHRQGMQRDPRFAPAPRRTQGALNFSSRPTRKRPPYDPGSCSISVKREEVVPPGPDSFPIPIDTTAARPPSATGAVTFADLRPHHCRWIADDGAYCGKPRCAPRPYCATHCDVAYELSAPSRNQRPLYHGRKK